MRMYHTLVQLMKASDKTQRESVHDSDRTSQMSGRQCNSTTPKNSCTCFVNTTDAKQGIIKYGEKGKIAILKELWLLHDTKVLLPVERKDMTYEEKEKYLNILCSWKISMMGQIKPKDVQIVYHRGYTQQNKRQVHPKYHLKQWCCPALLMPNKADMSCQLTSLELSYMLTWKLPYTCYPKGKSPS